METWLFQCNPTRFRIDDFLATGPAEANWQVNQHANSISPGDRVFIWRAIGNGPRADSGVVAEAEVVTRAAEVPDVPEGRPFWVDQTEAGEKRLRVELRFVRIADKRTMVSLVQAQEDPVLRNMRILRLRNETNYRLTPAEVSRLATLWDSASKTGRNPPWVRDELILTLDLYLRTAGNPPGKESPEIAKLSADLNWLAAYLGLAQPDQTRYRNANGTYMKLMNFRRLDPAFTEAGKVGLPRGGRLEEVIWNEFSGDPARCQALAETIRQALAAAPRASMATDLPADETEEAEEGRVFTALHRRFERNATIVATRKKRALARTGRLRCEVCDFDFRTHYGERGDGFIECHHMRPVHSLQPGEKTRVTDLALLCANCHRMVHAKRPWLSLDQLKEILRQAPSKPRTGGKPLS